MTTAAPKSKSNLNAIGNGVISNKKKSKKPKFSARHAKCWIYVTGLPPDTNEEEVAKFCSKVGIIDLDPETQKPKAKVYRHHTDTKDESGNTIQAGTCKGDASIGYARPESVELALQVLDEAPFRENFVGKDQNLYRIHVQRAKFEQHGGYEQQKDRKKRVSQAQRQVARLAAKQAIDWDDGEFNGRLTGGLKGLRIVVLKRMFHPRELPGGEQEDTMLAQLEQKVRSSCEEFGTVEKITVFSQNPQGVLVVKFTQPGAASEAVKAWNGRAFTFQKRERKVEASFWDGVTDFTVRDEEKDEKEMEQRHEEFGAWLESHKEDQLPEELRLKVE
jgi:RNA recognition motif-containing protein